MQYTITINQLAVINAGLNLDVVDMAIFDFVKQYAHSDKCMKLQTETGTYFWVSHNVIIQQLPILGISTGAGIIKRINKLIDSGLLARHPNCDLMRKTFYKFGANYDKVCFTTHNESLQPTTNVEGAQNESLGVSHNESCGNHYTKEHSTIEQNKAADGGLFPAEPGFVPVTVTRPRRTAEPAACLFENSRFADYNAFAAEFTAPEFADVDMVYYYHAVKDWSAQKGKKMKDWIATARNFMRGDMEKGKLHRLNPGGALSPDAIEYLKDKNGTQAAIRAGYSKKTARAIACEMLARPDVQQFVRERQEEARKNATITVDGIVEQLQEIASNVLSKDADRIRALELIGKYLGMFTERVEMKGQIDTAVTKLDGILKQLDE